MIAAFVSEMTASGYDARALSDAYALVNGRYLVAYRYPFWRVFRWDTNAAAYGGPAKGDWEGVTNAQNMRAACQAVCRG